MTEPLRPTLDQVDQSLRDALAAQDAARRLLYDPAGFFRDNGVDVSEGLDEEFNQFFLLEVDSAVTNRLSAAAEGQELSPDEAPELQGFGCSVCKVAVWSVAVALVALGAVAVVRLTPAAVLVLTLARILGRDPFDVARFLATIGPAVVAGVNAVATAICRWRNAC